MLVLLFILIGTAPLMYRWHRHPTIFVITPTYSRPNQMPELVRLCTVLNTAGNVHWIVVEDAVTKNRALTRFLDDCGLPYTHLSAPTSPYKRHVRGTNQRNEALHWLRKSFQLTGQSGVVYFADDDNTYHPDLFDEMRTLKRGATWPVGMIAASNWEGCITNPNDRSKISDFWTNWEPNRKFPIDMAGFAVNLNVVLEYPNALFDDTTIGRQEGLILLRLGFKNGYELEPKADGCRKILVWHTKSANQDVQVIGPATIMNML
ncbi:galactosylgalactosylxylosylprotein [Echinococcus multilocularis]|uniref:Galactosylgalactosylxylosylprotein 3-beta-glucuronosyltransferase n=1 Tax=Echinococcus multilocularis TaxID=6211 RepID=A0A087VYF7_ECHMU|nr:galactosylgalactosylxylosylprotein [Echinococcus multilocularis]